MKKRIKWNPRFMTSLFIAFMCTLSCFAQNVIKGSVSDGGGEPLPGVSVAVKGTTSGTITDMDGKFSINARNNDVLIFSYVGMNTQDIKVNGQHFISVTMKDDVASLDEVVVVGYGTQKRGSITGAISTVSDKELLKAPTMSISNVVGARIAGVAAVQSSGQPGSDNATLTMRGQSGIVYVIDGIRRTSADFNGLDPNEIESVSILKDASAVAVFSSLLPNREKRKRCLSLIPVRSVSAKMRNNKSGWTVPDMLTGIIKHGSYKVTLQYLLQKWCRK